jgi:PHAX RNA-binding domain-containing protein
LQSVVGSEIGRANDPARHALAEETPLADNVRPRIKQEGVMTSARPEPKPSKPLDPVAQQIATTLGETEPVPLMHIRRIVQTLGPERALQLLEQAMATEARGGLMLLDGSRRRTPGGVFFRLVREQTTPTERNRIWPWIKKPKPNTASSGGDPAR